jgi:uncharacterized HAD superfamily protein
MKPNIAFDIDGVVANFSEAFVPYANRRYGIRFIEGPKFHWDVEPEITPFLFEKLIAWFIRDHSNKIKVLEPGKAVVDYVWDKTRKPITFVTARHEMTVSATHHWVKTNFPGMDFILITVDGHSDKIRYLDGINSFVEDRRRTVIELAEAGKTVFMPMRHYNWPMPDDLNHYAMAGIIPLENISAITNGSFDHLIFKN